MTTEAWVTIIVGMLIVVSHVWTAIELHLLRQDIASRVEAKLEALTGVMKMSLAGNVFLAFLQAAASRRNNRGQNNDNR